MINEEELEKGKLRMLDVDNRVILPELTHARFNISSTDVIHSLASPSLYLILNINYSYKGLILYNGYIDIKNYLLIFIIFILIISAIIISINSVYPRTIFIKNTILNSKYIQNLTNITNKMTDQYRIIEYP